MRIIREPALIRIADGSQGLMADRLKRFDAKKLSAAILMKLASQFDNIDIVDVIVIPDKDRDGEDILRVDVIFTGDLRNSDAKKVAGASRSLIPTIEEMVDDDFYPLLSFVSKVDYDREHKREAR
jgi:hypothetical protein